MTKVKRKPKIPVVKEKDYIGSGAYKSCFKLSRGRVALISGYDEPQDHVIETDFERLKDIESLGLPTIKSKLGKVRYRGRVHKAIISPRYDEGGVRLHWIDKKLLTKAHHKQLLKIYRLVKKHKVIMSDMQFCINYGNKPEIVLSDPGHVELGASQSVNVSDMIAFLKNSGIKYR